MRDSRSNIIKCIEMPPEDHTNGEKMHLKLSSTKCWTFHLGFNMLTHLPLDKMADTIADDIFKHIFLNEDVRILIQILLKFVPMGSNDNKSALVQVMAWRRTSDKPLPEQTLTQFFMHICGTRGRWVNRTSHIYAVLSFYRLTPKKTAKLCITGPLWGESTNDWWIPLTRSQWCRQCFTLLLYNVGGSHHKEPVMRKVVTSSCWWVNSSPPSAACMCQWTGSALVQVMACRLFGAKPLPEPMLPYYQLNP